MALVRPPDQLDAALAEFNGKLTQEEKLRFRANQVVPDASSVMVLTAQLDQAAVKRSGRCIASRLSVLLTAVQQFSGIVGTFVSSNPSVAALVWGSVQFMLHFANSSFSYFDKLSLFLMGIAKICPRFADYQKIYHDAPKLQAALRAFFAEIIRCCTHVCEVLRRSDWVNYMRSAWVSFDAEFSPFQARIRALADDVNEEIRLAAARAFDDERAAQEAHRASLRRLMRRNEQRSLRKREDSNLAKRQVLLDKLSSYNQETAYHQARLKCHAGTAEWLFDEPDFKDWISSDVSSTFWLSGKLGCGKTILLSNVVAHLFAQHSNVPSRVAYFFCRFNEKSSLQATTVARSIIRQFLSAHSLNNDIENSIASLFHDGPIRVQELEQLLSLTVSRSPMHFIVIDGIDKCPDVECRDLLRILDRALCSSATPVKLLLASRSRPSQNAVLSSSKICDFMVREPAVAADIEVYVATELKRSQEENEFVVSDPNLVPHIQNILVEKAQNMFLWVVFQLDEIFHQTCDKDIRSALDTLPTSLEETYIRMQSRIDQRRKLELARQVFPWVAVAKRPLTLQELQEALAVEKFAPYSKPERMIPDFGRVVSWCEGLLVHDEVTDEVSFAHPTILRVLTYQPEVPKQGQVKFSITAADKEVGEICTTYLNFNDFKTEMVKQNNCREVQADDVVEATLTNTSPRFARPFLKYSRSRSTRPQIGIDLQQYAKNHLVEEARHPFLAYAAEYWLPHSSNFHIDDRIWHFWRLILLGKSNLAPRPWTADEWTSRDDILCTYIAEQNHVALFTMIHTSTLPLEVGKLKSMLRTAAELGNSEVWHALRKVYDGNALSMIVFCAENGLVEGLKILLDKGADVNARRGHYGHALQVASRYNDETTVQFLLDNGADVNAQGGYYGNALQAALTSENKGVVQILLNNGADVNAQGGYFGNALQIASCTNDETTVQFLLDNGADVNAQGGHYGNALQAASRGYDEKIVQILLENGADVNAQGGHYGNALQAASFLNNEGVVQLLLDNGADVNAQGGHYGSALKAAESTHNSKVVELLKSHGARP